MWWISSRTNSPACVLGDFPCSSSRRALSTTSSSGIFHLHKLQIQSLSLRAGVKYRISGRFVTQDCGAAVKATAEGSADEVESFFESFATTFRSAGVSGV
jgi:hypothetical protein